MASAKLSKERQNNNLKSTVCLTVDKGDFFLNWLKQRVAIAADVIAK